MTIERTTVHVSDDTGRIAMLENRTVGNAIDDQGTAEELIRYIYSNHVQSSTLELDATGAIISYEEYHPYGTTSYQAMNVSIHAIAKRYRYTGKERDEESGLYYHGARYYIPWLCRWSAVDPLESEYSPQSPYTYGNSNPIVFNDPTGKSGEKPGLWIETFNAQEKMKNLTFAKGAQSYEDAIEIITPLEGYDFTGNYYERFAYKGVDGTVLGLSDGNVIQPSSEGYSGEFIDMAKEGAIYSFDNYAEAKIKSIVESNKALGIKVDNFGTVRTSPGLYKDFYSRILKGEDVWKDLGGSSKRGSFTTRLSDWQEPFSNYITPNTMKWSNAANIFSEGLGIVGDAISLVEVAKGGSPLGLLPIPLVSVDEKVRQMEEGLFDFALNNESLRGMIGYVEAGKKNTRLPLNPFFQELRFVYTTDEQVNILSKGKLNYSNPYFSYPNESATKATLIQVQGNNFTILKTYDYNR